MSAVSASATKLIEQAETIGDGLLEAAITVMFSPSVEACDKLTAAATGAITFARALRVELMKSASVREVA